MSRFLSFGREWSTSDAARAVAFPALVAVALIAKLVVARWLALGHGAGSGVVSDVLLLACGVLAASLLPPRPARWSLLALDAVVTAALLGTIVYLRYFDQMPGFALFRVAAQVGTLGDSVADLLQPSDALFAVDLPILFLLATRLPSPASPPPRATRRASIVATVAAAGVFTATVASAAALPGPVDGRRVAFTRGIFAYQASTLLPRPVSSMASGEGSAGDPAVAISGGLQRRIDALSRRRGLGRLAGAPELGAFEGANVILIQVEALQSGLLGARVDGQPVVPHIERFLAGSWYFPNTVSQIGKANTADAEFVANTSLYPALEEATPLAYAGKRIPSLPRLLAADGYDTFTMHTNDVAFWNRDELYPALGFDRFYDDDFFGRDDVTGHGASDRVLFERALPELREAAARGPFYAHLITVSAHHPFTGAEDRGTLLLPEAVSDTPTGRYLRSQSYADAELGRFLTALQREGLLDTSIVVLYGDHFGLKMQTSSDAEDTLRTRLFGHPYNRADFYTVPLIVRVPGQRDGSTVTSAMGQIDILPTVADLLGLDLSAQPHFGRSAFARTPTLLTKGGALDLYVDDELTYIAGLTDSEDLAFSTRTKLPVESARPAGLADAARLLAISGEYAEALPQLGD